MKVRIHYKASGSEEIYKFLRNHLGEAIITAQADGYAAHFIVEREMTEAEMHMYEIRTLLDSNEYLSEEEKAALEYSIECIKTLDDMGLLKGAENND